MPPTRGRHEFRVKPGGSSATRHLRVRYVSSMHVVMGGVSARLMVSLSGINAWTLDRASDLSKELASRGVPFSMLFAPRISGADQPGMVLSWVREQRAAGNALLQHGYD